MPQHIRTIRSEEPPRPPFRSTESRVERLEAFVTLLVRHIRGTDVMSDVELEKIERDLQMQ